MCTPYVKFKYIFQFLTPILPIHYATFIGLWTSNVKGQIGRKFSKSRNLQNYDPLGALGGMKSCDFYCKRHILA